MADDALFVQPAPNVFVPTGYSRGPWDDRHCHGGPVGALLARAVERLDDGTAPGHWQIARLTVELTRPVPVGAELHLTAEVERAGRSVSLAAVRLTADDVVVAHVRALRIRRAELDLSGTIEPHDPVPPGAAAGEPVRWQYPTDDTLRFHSHGCEHRVVAGVMGEPGPTTDWVALRVPVLAGEQPSGVQRVAAAADFGNGISSGIPGDDVVYINPDLTIHLVRPPVGDWIAIDSTTHYGLPAGVGVAMAESAIYDVDGRVGRSVQSLILQAR